MLQSFPAGGSHRISRETPFAEVLVHSERVLVKISAGDSFFEAKAKIVYSQPNMGAGVGFLEVGTESQAALERWLDEAEKEKQQQGG